MTSLYNNSTKSGSSRLETCRDDNFLLNNAVSGFTLIELLVVVLIIGILSAVALPQYQKAVEKARSVEILSAVNTLSKNAEMYLLSGNTDIMSIADFDIALSCTYDEADRNCYTKHAQYSLLCGGGTHCVIETFRVDNGGTKSQDFSHNWSINKVWNNGQLTANKCITQLTETGRQICKGLISLGYEYEDAEL